MVLFMVFVFGLAVGSFLSAFVYRLEKGESALHGRSYCPQCKHTLAWYDLIPLLSFLFLMGRCRYCKDKISFQYPFVELATGFIFVALFSAVFPWSRQVIHTLVSPSFLQTLELLYLWATASLLIVIFVYDLRHFLIPDAVLFLAVGIAVLWRIVEFLNIGNLESLLSAIVAGLGASAFFLAIYLVSKGKWMGFGDVKLAFLLGLFLGWPSVLIALFAAFCLGALIGLMLIALQKRGLRSEVPFAPFLIVGTVIAFFFGSSAIDWYLGLFLV